MKWSTAAAFVRSEECGCYIDGFSYAHLILVLGYQKNLLSDSHDTQ